jgi:putative DNA primase/helicase
VLDSGIELGHDPDRHGWVAIRVDGHFENYPIRSRPFRLFLLRTYYRETANSPGAQAIRATRELFEAKALFDSEESPINLRVASYVAHAAPGHCRPRSAVVVLTSYSAS